MLDAMSLGGCAGIAVGRLACFFSAADRGQLMPFTALPLAYPVNNVVTGAPEYRLATFVLQAMAAALIFAALAVFFLLGKKRRTGDVTLLFLLLYGLTQAVLDSTRYDSLYLRSNGFVSAVQLLSAAALVGVSALFSARMVKGRGMRRRYVPLWIGMLALLGGAGYMEYFVQRHGDRRLYEGRGFGVRERAGGFCARRGDRRLCNQSHVAGHRPRRRRGLTDKADEPTVRYRQGVDYDLNARTGLLRVRESCSADTVFLTADCESSDEQLVDALTASDVTGELLFVGQPDQGPGLVVQCWKVTLSLSGEVGLISEELASIPMTGEVLADDLNHPESPFFRVRYLG